MARKIKKGIDYFPHSCIHDNELKYLDTIFEHGYRTYFKLLEHIYGVEGYFAKADAKSLTLLCEEIKKVSEETFEEIITTCLNEGLFHKEMYDKHKILTSKSIQVRYLEVVKRRKEIELIKDYLLIDESSDGSEVKDKLRFIEMKKTRKRKNPKEEKKDDSKKEEKKQLHSLLRKEFEDHYNKNMVSGEAKYYWDGKDASNLDKLTNKIKDLLKTKKPDYTLKDVRDTFVALISNIDDKWILENYTIPNINSKFNIIVKSLINRGRTEQITDRGKFKDVMEILDQ